jgi:ATP-dependent helicase YprA (DUF1998 family)
LAVQSIGEIIQSIARQRGRGDTQQLLSLFQLEGASGERISHLPIEAELAQAWVALTGEPFRPHQAHALTALRRGEPVALRAADASVAMSAHLLLYAMLLADPTATALALAPDEEVVRATRAHLARINQDLPRPLQIESTLLEPNRRPDHYARIVIATPETVHSRLLRHHDRAWRLFWPRLQLVALPEVQRYNGVAAAHLADLLTRMQRVVAGHNGHGPNLLATLLDVADAEPVLTSLLGQPWRIVPADDGGRAPTTLAVWRAGTAWLRDSAELAMAIQRHGYQVHIACQPLERALLDPIIGDLPRITFGPNMGAGQVLVTAGYPGSHSALRRMLRAGYQAVVLVLGELPHEQALARHVETLLSDPATSWAPTSTNAYVLARHVLCAASERPLTEAEVEAWGVQDIVARLVDQGQLVDLPDAEVAWKPTDATGDPYADFSLHSASGAAIVARGEQGQPLATIQPAVYERWGFPNAALPPGTGGFRVLARDDESGLITLRLESNGRRTYPLRRCQVTVREARETRALPGSRPIGWGRVVVSEEIYGYREAAANGAPADIALKPTLHTRWIAPACWFDLAAGVQVNGQLIGWSLAAALPLRALCDITDVVPCYDHEARRLYLVDAQPGGSGLATWAYAHAEELLPLAYDVALACRTDPLLEPLSRVDMDWLLALLGRQAAEAAAIEQPRTSRPARAEPRRPTELVEGPPPSAPRIITTPPPVEQRPAAIEQPALPGDTAMPASQTTSSREGRPAALPAESRPRHASSQDPQPAARTPERAAPARPPVKEPPQPAPARDPARRANPPAKPSAPPQRGRPAPERGSRSQAPAAQPTPAHASPDQDAPPDPNALIERLRRQRQQREAEQSAASSKSAPRSQAQNSDDSQVERRFVAGEKIFCLPYGDGVVRESRVQDGRELLTVNFSSHGDLTIDPMVSLVRKLENAAQDDDLL